MSKIAKINIFSPISVVKFMILLCIIGGLSGCADARSNADSSSTSESSSETDSKESAPESDLISEQIKASIPEPNTDTEITTETETATITNENIVSSKLFEEVYVPYANREKPFVFNTVMTYAQSVDYDTEIVEPTESEIGSIKIIDTTGDYVYFSFLPINDIETISTVSYYQSATNSEVSLNNYSSDGSEKYDEFNTHIIGEQSTKVNGIDDQRIFLFSE